MKVGLTLAGDLVSEDRARFAAQLGVTDVVVHLSDHAAVGDQRAYVDGRVAGPADGDARDNRPWTYDDFTRLTAMPADHVIKDAATENALGPSCRADIRRARVTATSRQPAMSL